MTRWLHLLPVRPPSRPGLPSAFHLVLWLIFSSGTSCWLWRPVQVENMILDRFVGPVKTRQTRAATWYSRPQGNARARSVMIYPFSLGPGIGMFFVDQLSISISSRELHRNSLVVSQELGQCIPAGWSQMSCPKQVTRGEKSWCISEKKNQRKNSRTSGSQRPRLLEKSIDVHQTCLWLTASQMGTNQWLHHVYLRIPSEPAPPPAPFGPKTNAGTRGGEETWEPWKRR